MKKQLLHITAFGITACMVLFLAAEPRASDDATSRGKQKPAKTSGRRGSFSISTVCSGSIDDRIAHAGREYRITGETAIYVVGEGPKESGIWVRKASVFVSGVDINGVPTARMILIRRDESIFEEYMEAERPVKAIPSEVNPDVGELAENAPQ